MNKLKNAGKAGALHILGSLLVLVCVLPLATPPAALAQASLSKLLSPANLPDIRNDRVYQVSSYDTTGGNHDYISIPTGDTATIMNVSGPGIIARMWMTVGSSDPYYLRQILILMYWDGESSPSVEVPLGDFFGTGFRYKQWISRFLGMSSGGFYCYFPMPFEKSARIEVVNQTGRTVQSVYYNIDYQKLTQPLGSDVGYFHAWWHRVIRTTSNHNYTILDAEGKGQFVGLNLNIQGYDHNLWFLEGDEMMYVDGEKKPSIHGTGTEDFFNSGWYFDQGEYSAPFHGLIIKNDSLSRIAAYRFFVGDAIPFKHSIRVTIEHGTQNTEAADYSSTAYWYQLEPHKPFPPILRSSLRIPLRVAVPNGAVEAESITPVKTSLKSSVENMDAYGPDWSNGEQLKVTAERKGDSFVLPVPVSETDEFNVDLYYTKGPDYGNVKIMENGKKVGQINGYSKQVYPGGAIELDHLISVGKSIPIHFVVTGKNPMSKGYVVGLDAFILHPDRHFIKQWDVIGPFPNPTNSAGKLLGLDTVYPPERNIDLKASYTGVDGQKVKWQVMKADQNGYMNLVGKFNPYQHVVAYAVVFVHSPKNQDLPLLLGSDDGAKVILNGKQLFRILLIRSAAPDQNRVNLPLKKGWNTLMLKDENNVGDYGFYARILSAGKGLTYSLNKPK